MKTAILIFFIITLIKFSSSQTCCSAGTPILSAIETSNTASGQLRFTLTADHNSIKDVLNGSRSIEPIRERSGNSLLLDISYGLNDYWSFTVLIPFIEQQRKLVKKNTSGSNEKIITRGFGDLLVLFKYNILVSSLAKQRQLAVGYGLKMPTGRSDLKDNNGFLISADLQSGTGSWDHLFLLYYAQSFRPDAYSFFGNISYRLNGNNNRFQISSGPFSNYQFGNVFSLTLGASYKLNTLFDLSVQGRFRKSEQDRFGQQEISNTGGNWVYIIPGLNVNIDPVSLRFFGQLPVYRKLDGIQLTTTFTAGISVFYSIF